MSTDLIITGGASRPITPPGQAGLPSGGGRPGARAPSEQVESPAAPRPAGRHDPRPYDPRLYDRLGEGAAMSPRGPREDRPAEDKAEILRPLPVRPEAGPRTAPSPGVTTLFLAQQIAQEMLSEGLYIDPHPAATAAYRAAPSARVAFFGPLDGVDIAV